MDEIEIDDYTNRLDAFVGHRLTYLTELKRCYDELVLLKNKQSSLAEEKTELDREIDVISLQQQQAEDQLKRKIADVDTRIAHLKMQYASIHNNINRDKATKKQLDDIKFSIDSYEEHREEFFDRLHEGNLSQ
jgi:chromosome segregation ATPase